MKKLLMSFVILLLGFAFVGCKDKVEKVNIDFRFGETSKVVKLEKGAVITLDVIPFIDNITNYELYYDEGKTKKYNNEEINKDTIIYIIEISDDEILKKEELINTAKQAYLEKFIKNKRDDGTIEDVRLFNFLGIYNESLVGVFLDKKNCVFPDVIVPCIIETFDFTYSRGHPIIVFNNGTFFYLPIAYSQGIITYNDLLVLNKIYNKID